jgi:hypothetical protein
MGLLSFKQRPFAYQMASGHLQGRYRMVPRGHSRQQ